MEALPTETAPVARLRRDSPRPKKTAMLLAQQIVSDISDRQLARGAPLLSERAMLDEYGVARGSLREALRFLEIHGVISIKTGPGGGPVVGEPSSRHLATTITMMLQLEGTRFREVLDARAVLEPALAGRAAERVDREQLAALHDSIKRMREIESYSAFLAENDVFHEIVAHAAGNHLFGLLIASLTWVSDAVQLGVDYSPELRRSVCTEHQRIHEAIESREPDRAAAAMRGHILNFAAYVERFHPRVAGAPMRWEQLD